LTSNHFVASPGVLGVASNQQDVKWSFALAGSGATPAEYQECRVQLEYVVEDVEFRPADGKYHYFSGDPGADELLYHRPYFFGRTLALRLSGLVAGRPRLTVNADYARLVTHRFMNLHSAGYILTDLACLSLLGAGLSPVHCSGFALGDRGVVVLAPPNTGKTLTALMACADLGADFMAEDLAVSDGTTLHAVPWTSTFRYYARGDANRGESLRASLSRRIAVAELLPSKARSLKEYLPDTTIRPSAPITDVVILERGEEAVMEVDRAEMQRRAVNLNRFEFKYDKAPALVAYEYFNPAADLTAAASEERRVLETLIAEAERAVVVRARDPRRYADLIVSSLR
jgi:hypothetical protein